MEQQTVVHFLTLKGIKTKEIDIEIRNTYGDEALQIFTVKKWRTRFLQRRTKLGDNRRSGRPASSDLAQTIAEFIRELPFLSCKILHRHLTLSKETCLRILHEKLWIKKLHL
jgi:transposase